MIRLISGLLFLACVLGCKSRPLGPFVSPRIVGQVVAQDTQAALAGVSVTRNAVDLHRGSPPKGAELLMLKPPVRTDENGRFELASERVLSIVRGAGWNVVSLSFERAGYRSLETNCLTSAATNAPTGEPLLDVGRICLRPVVK